MSEKHDANPKDRITAARMAEYLRVALEFLAERGGSARKSDVITAVRSRINPTPYERELSASNAERWHTAMVCQAIGFKTAGYLDRGDGIWRLTDAGRDALATMTPLEMFERAREKYAEWNRSRDGDPTTVKGGAPAVTPARRIWLIGTGREGDLWDRCRTEGEIRIGFTFGGTQVGDLGAMTRDEIYARIRTLTGEPKPYHTQLACWEFAHEMREGDLVIARAGVRRVLGVGRITGPYEFDASLDEYPHRRAVRWFWTKERRLPERVFLHTKTLTDMTRFGDLVDVMLGRRTQDAVNCLGNYKYGTDEIDRYFEADPVEIDDDDSVLETVVDDAPPAALFSEVFRGKFPGRDELNDMVRELERKKALILQGPPGTGKTFIATQLAEHFAGDPRRVTRLQFHPAYSYEDFIRGIRPNDDHFEAVDGPLVEAARRAMHDPKRHVLLIDEFNRGNVARILGESLSLIEADKRDRRHAVRLGLAGEALPGGEPHELWLPPNLYILATMNTADRSIALVDHALRRRFSFIDLKPAFDDRAFEEDLVDRFDGDAGESDAREVADVKAVAADIVKAMREINGRIAAERSLGAGHCLGHSFFCGDPANRDIRDWARRIFEREIKPHLRECCVDQPRLLDDLLRLVPSLDR